MDGGRNERRDIYTHAHTDYLASLQHKKKTRSRQPGEGGREGGREMHTETV